MFWKISTLLRVSKWTWIAISPFNLSGENWEVNEENVSEGEELMFYLVNSWWIFPHPWTFETTINNQTIWWLLSAGCLALCESSCRFSPHLIWLKNKKIILLPSHLPTKSKCTLPNKYLTEFDRKDFVHFSISGLDARLLMHFHIISTATQTQSEWMQRYKVVLL